MQLSQTIPHVGSDWGRNNNCRISYQGGVSLLHVPDTVAGLRSVSSNLPAFSKTPWRCIKAAQWHLCPLGHVSWLWGSLFCHNSCRRPGTYERVYCDLCITVQASYLQQPSIVVMAKTLLWCLTWWTFPSSLLLSQSLQMLLVASRSHAVYMPSTTWRTRRMQGSATAYFQRCDLTALLK